MGLSGLRMDGGLPKWDKTCYTYSTMMKLGTAIPYLKRIEKYKESCKKPLNSAQIKIYSLEPSNFCYIRKLLFLFFRLLLSF